MNIIFIVIDTLRATRLGCYGYGKPTSPSIDKLASEGALFERCFAPGIPTTPSHTTMFTGLHPITHNIVCHGGQVDLDRKIPVLPEMMQGAGFTTAAVDNLYDIKPWLARGYEYYINPSFRHKLRLLVSCDQINARAIPWLKSHASEHFFLFLHYWEPHTPYLPPTKYRTFYPSDLNPCSPEFTSFAPIKKQPFWEMFGDIWFDKLGTITDAEYISSLYDAEIRRVDDGVAEIIEAVDTLGLAEETLIVLTGDHGESLTSHDIYFDHHGLYDDVIHVPLIMRLKGTIPAGIRVKPMVQHLDIAPTMLEAAAVKLPLHLEGHSLLPLATGVATEGGYEKIICCENTWQSKWAIRTETMKLILSRQPDYHGMPRRELYNLVEDPEELINIAEIDVLTADKLEAELETWIIERLANTARTEDPLKTQEITLGRRWPEYLKRSGLPDPRTWSLDTDISP